MGDPSIDGPFPRMHPREAVVTKARLRITTVILDVEKELELTAGELLQILTTVVSSQIGVMAKYMIRAERHPGDPDKPGGWA